MTRDSKYSWDLEDDAQAALAKKAIEILEKNRSQLHTVLRRFDNYRPSEKRDARRRCVDEFLMLLAENSGVTSDLVQPGSHKHRVRERDQLARQVHLSTGTLLKSPNPYLAPTTTNAPMRLAPAPQLTANYQPFGGLPPQQVSPAATTQYVSAPVPKPSPQPFPMPVAIPTPSPAQTHELPRPSPAPVPPVSPLILGSAVGIAPSIFVQTETAFERSVAHSPTPSLVPSPVPSHRSPAVSPKGSPPKPPTPPSISSCEKTPEPAKRMVPVYIATPENSLLLDIRSEAGHIGEVSVLPVVPPSPVVVPSPAVPPSPAMTRKSQMRSTPQSAQGTPPAAHPYYVPSRAVSPSTVFAPPSSVSYVPNEKLPSEVPESIVMPTPVLKITYPTPSEGQAMQWEEGPGLSPAVSPRGSPLVSPRGSPKYSPRSGTQLETVLEEVRTGNGKGREEGIGHNG